MIERLERDAGARPTGSGAPLLNAPLLNALGLKAWLLAGAGLLAFAGAPALAQTAAPRTPDPDEAAADTEYEVEELVVTAAAGPPRGAVLGDIPAEVQLNPREIRALGASSVAELLDALEPQLASSRGRGGGRPITLVNGQRISSFSEIRDLPPEAILRMEIFPEEVALKYGYRADQRVVNFVLRRRFRALTTEAGARLATAGGRASYDANANALQIQRETRLQVDVKGGASTPLLESERNVVGRSGAGGPDEAPFRTLMPSAENLSLNAILSRPLKEGISATVNGSLDFDQSESRLGLASGSLTVPADNPFSDSADDVELELFEPAAGAMRRYSETLDGHLGVSVNGARSGWRWSFTGNADRTRKDSLTETGLDLTDLQAAVRAGDPTVNPFATLPPDRLSWRAPDQARSTVTSADGEVLLNGSLFRLPAGDVTTALTAGLETHNFESESLRAGVARSGDLSRHIARAQANVDFPLASRARGVLEPLGDLSLNVNLAVDRLSDFGSLTTVGGGVNWSPWEPLRFIASVTEEDGAPTIQQLGDPEVATPGVRVFDFRRGETVEVIQVSGGAPGLLADSRRVIKLGVNFKPFEETDLRLRADYTRSRIRDVIAGFPTATAEIEAAFPERFVRNAAGVLTQIDIRPVNFARQDREEIRWGFNYSRSLGPQRRPGQGGPPGARPQRPEGEGGQRRAEGGGGGRGGGGSLQLSVFHTVRLSDEVLIRPGVPVLDFLHGAAAGNGGGTPRHQVDVQATASRNGYGARLTARWQSGTDVRGAALGGQDLTFSDLTTVNLRLFADLGQQPMARQHPWMRGARVTVSLDNVFDERLQVRDAAGVTPISYQPDLIDPLGRTVRLSFRKLFF